MAKTSLNAILDEALEPRVELLPPERRFQAYAEGIRSAFSLPLEFSRPSLERIDAQVPMKINVSHLGESRAGYVESTAYRADLPRGSGGAETVSIIFLLKGRMGFMQDGREAHVSAGEAFIFNAARPAVFDFRTRFTEVVLGLPKSVVSRYFPNPDRFSALPIPTDANLSLLRSLTLAAAMTSEGGAADAAALDRLTDTFTTLAGTALSNAFRVEGASVPHREALLLVVQDFMRRHMDDPTLTPEKIAAANHIAERSLYELFKKNGFSVMDWLYRLRLEKARERLADPAWLRLSIAEVGYACGFTNSAHFSTRFRKQFGMTPKAFRSGALRRIELI